MGVDSIVVWFSIVVLWFGVCVVCVFDLLFWCVGVMTLFILGLVLVCWVLGVRC